MTTHTKLIATIVLAAALLAPVAQAQSPDDRAGMRGPGAFESTVTSSHPDNRGDARGPGAITTTLVAQPTSDSFDWRDALIGGLGGVGAALLLTGCFFLLTSQRSKARLA